MFNDVYPINPSLYCRLSTEQTDNSSFQNYPHPDDHAIRTTDTPRFKPFTMISINRLRFFHPLDTPESEYVGVIAFSYSVLVETSSCITYVFEMAAV